MRVVSGHSSKPSWRGEAREEQQHERKRSGRSFSTCAHGFKIKAVRRGEQRTLRRARDLYYTRRRFITRDALRAAIAQVVDAVFAARRPDIWGEATTACASDSEQFGAFD